MPGYLGHLLLSCATDTRSIKKQIAARINSKTNCLLCLLAIQLHVAAQARAYYIPPGTASGVIDSSNYNYKLQAQPVNNYQAGC